MTSINSDQLWPYYVPTPGANFQPFEVMNEPVNDELAANSNPYTPSAANVAQKAERTKLQLSPSPLSGKANVPVATWVTENRAKAFVKEGFFFDYQEGQKDLFTWGSSGHYLLVLDESFWK